MDYSTRLPPRKRLLAGMKRQNCANEDLSEPLELPSMFHSLELRARVREVLNCSYTSVEEFVEASKSVALAAHRVAAEARAGAVEKAETATRVKAFARSVLEAVALSESVSEETEATSLLHVRGKKKRVAVGDLYNKSEQFTTDEDERARILHQAVDSSPTKKPERKHRNVVKIKDLSNAASAVTGRNSAAIHNGNDAGSHIGPSGKENNGIPLKPEKLSRQKEGPSHCEDKSGSNCRAVPAGKKGKAKKKEVLLSHFCSKGSAKSQVSESQVCHSFSAKAELGSNAANSSSFHENNSRVPSNISDENQS